MPRKRSSPTPRFHRTFLTMPNLTLQTFTGVVAAAPTLQKPNRIHFCGVDADGNLAAFSFVAVTLPGYTPPDEFLRLLAERKRNGRVLSGTLTLEPPDYKFGTFCYRTDDGAEGSTRGDDINPEGPSLDVLTPPTKPFSPPPPPPDRKKQTDMDMTF